MLGHIGSLLAAAASLLLVDDPAPPSPLPVPMSPVVQVGDRTHAFCSGFFIGTPDIIVTAGHCFFGTGVNGDDMRVLPAGFSGDTQLMVARFVGGGSPMGGLDDWALLRLQTAMSAVDAEGKPISIYFEDDTLSHDWQPATLDCAYVPKIGDEVTADGFPAVNTGETFMKGFINGVPRALPPTWDQAVITVTMSVSGGASGSPVYEKDGRVIGIVVGENSVQTGFAYVQPITPVCQALHLS